MSLYCPAGLCQSHNLQSSTDRWVRRHWGLAESKSLMFWMWFWPMVVACSMPRTIAQEDKRVQQKRTNCKKVLGAGHGDRSVSAAS